MAQTRAKNVHDWRKILRQAIATATLIAVGLLANAANSAPDHGAERYMQDLLDRLSANSERTQEEMQAFIRRMVRHEFNWTLVVSVALTPNAPTAEHYRKLGPWLIDHLSGRPILDYMVGRVFRNCSVTESDKDREGLSVWARCQTKEKNISREEEEIRGETREIRLRFQLKKLHDTYQITDLETEARDFSLLRFSLSALRETTALREHGVRQIARRREEARDE
ncbi:MAG: hypothetical protein AAB597_03480 [Patescibacteria group bacterium]